MLKVIVTAVATLVSLIAFSQVSENRNVGDFSKLKASSGVEVFYTVSNTSSVKAEADDNEKLGYLKTEVDGQTLKIFVATGSNEKYSSKRGKGRNINGVNFKILKVFVTGKALTEIKASSSANVKMENLNSTDQLTVAVSSSGSISGSFDCNDLNLDASSSGDFNGKVNAKTITVEASSSSDVALNGKTERLTVKASSSSDVDSKALSAEAAIVKSSSSAEVTVNAKQSLEADASSSAAINYYGNPSQVKVEESSSGSVNKR